MENQQPANGPLRPQQSFPDIVEGTVEVVANQVTDSSSSEEEASGPAKSAEAENASLTIDDESEDLGAPQSGNDTDHEASQQVSEGTASLDEHNADGHLA